MTEKEKNELISIIKTRTQNHTDLTSISNERLKTLIASILEEHMDYIKDNTKEERHPELVTLNFKEKRSIIETTYDSIRGLGALGAIISDSDVTEVMINGYKDIFIEKHGRLHKLESSFESSRELEIIITKFVSKAGRAVNESQPIVDFQLEDGSRVNVVMKPIALNGPIVTIRRFPKEAMTVSKLIEFGSITEDVADILQQLVTAKYNIFVSGGTGSGKTTF